MKNIIILLSLFFMTSNIHGQVGWKKHIISLNSDNISKGWKFTGIKPQEEINKIDSLPTREWRNIQVPGDINEELIKQHVIPDVHFDTLARSAYWITSKDWWYKLQFDADFDQKKKTDLVLDFVDGISEIWLNGEKLGKMSNAFYPHRFNVKEILKKKNNILYIRFLSIEKLLGGKRLDELQGWRERRSFIRKPQYNFGWDWALPLPGIGLAGDVYIENGNEFEIKELGIKTFVDGRIDFNFEVSKLAKEAGYKIIISIDGHGTHLTDTIEKTKISTYRSYKSFSIKNPNLWWPNGYGKPNLYNYKIRLLVNKTVVDSRKGKIGIKESKIRETPFTPKAGTNGYSFEILINNQSIFCKGSNWIPIELWPGTIPPDKYRFYLEKAKEANFNMIRVWGGGIYEKDLFYDICDELGIMVWQDFMFASAGYPADILMNEIITETKYQIFRLRNHPSIVIWCGGNEDYLSWSHPDDIAVTTQSDIMNQVEKDSFYVNRKRDDVILHSGILRGFVSRFGFDTPFVESSPMSKDDYGNSPNSGNSHLSSWKYALFECGDKPSLWKGYLNNVCSFNSEFCIQGPANISTIKSFLKEENYWPPNDAWIYHIQRGHGNLPHYVQTMFIAGDIFGEINSLETYVKYGQATHVEQTRAEYESARYDRPNNGGTMSWMYNDCWPTSNWSIIDYYYQPKPAYYAAKRACKPVLPIIFERNNIIRFAVANETNTSKQLELKYGLCNLSGKIKWQKTKELNLKQNSTEEYDRINRSELNLSEDCYLFVKAFINGKEKDVITYFPDGYKNIHWINPDIKIEMLNQTQKDGKWETVVKLTTDNYARLCHLLWNNAPKPSENMPFPSVWFVDNYFDLPANDSKNITIQSDHKIEMNELTIGHWLTKWQ